MQTKTKEKKTSKRRTTQKLRRNLEFGKKVKHLQRLRHKRAKNYSNVNLYTTDYIKPLPSLKTENAIGAGIFNKSNDAVKMIKDLYPIIKKVPGCINNEEYFFDDLEPVEFLHWILKAYDDIQVEEWSVLWSDKKKRYDICYYHEYEEIGIQGRSQSLRFLEKIKLENEKLYELFIAYLYHLNQAIHPVFWFDHIEDDYHLDYFQNMATEYAESDDEDEKADSIIYQQTVDMFRSGKAFELSCAIKACDMSKELFQKAVKNFKGKNKKERKIIDFIITHMNLVDENEYVLGDFYHIGKEEDGSPPSFADYACFLYSYDEDDVYFKHTNEVFTMNANEYGIIPMRQIMLQGSGLTASDLPNRYVAMLAHLGKIVEMYPKYQ